MRILGIDVGTAIVGWGIIDTEGSTATCVQYGTITTPKTDDMPDRLRDIYDSLLELIGLYKPEQAAVESLFFSKNQKTVMTVSQARGVILLALQTCGLPIYEYTPLQVKSGVTGYGKAEKLQVQKMVQLTLKLKELPTPDDAADALAIALYHMSVIKFATKVLNQDTQKL